MSTPDLEPAQSTRRGLIRAAAGAALLAAADAPPAPGKGRLRQSIAHWCFEPHFTLEALIAAAKSLGIDSIELIAAKHFPTLKQHGMTCAIAQIDMGGEPPFLRGFNNPAHRDAVSKATRDAIDACAQYGYKNVISFTGMADGISREQGATNCVEGYKPIVDYAARAGVTLCLEMLNTRDRSHPMKGHPGYQGDHTEYCVDIIRRVDSPNLKLLFDVYHVQIMDGDVIRRLREHKALIGHVHTAGNPGRGELDESQEINYPAVMRALADVGYTDYVGQEFIPTRDAMASLKQAVAACAV